MTVKTSHRYDDLIDLEYPRPDRDLKKHPPMPMINRAAQFAPFAALTGYDAAIDETARITGEENESGGVYREP